MQSEDTGGADLIEQPSMDEPTEETDLEHSDIDDEPEFMDDKDTDSVPEPEYMEEDPPFASSPKSAGLPDSIIGSYHQHPTVDVPEQAPSGMNVRERSDRAAKQRAVANQTGGVTNRPGAVAVSPTTTPSVSSPIARDSQDATANHMPGSDSFIKARAGRSGTKVPGAVSVEPTHVAPPPTSVMSQGDEDEMSKARSARPSRLHDQHQHQQQHSATYIASQTEQDAEAKARARGSVGNTSPIQPGAVGVGQSVDMESVDESHDFDQMARRREDRALARADRLGMRDSSVGAVLVTPTESTAESRKMEQDSKRGFVMSTPSNGAATTSHESTPVFSQMPEEERQRRFDAKMAQMNQGHQDSREKRGTDQSIATTNSAVFSNMSEDDREHRFDVKMAQMDQQHDDNREKHAAAIDLEDDPLYERRHQPTSLRSNGNPDKFDHIDPMDSNPSATGITTTADRGMAVAPDVEYGEYTQPRVNDNDLVVAIAIDEEEEEEDEKLYAYAVEYDPNSKPPLYQNRRCRLYGIIGAVGFLVLVIVLIVSVVATKNNVVVSTFAPSVSPTLSPTSALESAYRSVFAQAVSEKVYEQGTPHYSAANWIIYDDPMKLEETHPNLLQRYMMAFLYFHTTENGTKEWRSCNPPKDGEDDTCEFMEFVRMQDDSIAYVPRSGLTRWLSGLDECSWVGVECAGGPAILGFRLCKSMGLVIGSS